MWTARLSAAGTFATWPPPAAAAPQEVETAKLAKAREYRARVAYISVKVEEAGASEQHRRQALLDKLETKMARAELVGGAGPAGGSGGWRLMAVLVVAGGCAGGGSAVGGAGIPMGRCEAAKLHAHRTNGGRRYLPRVDDSIQNCERVSCLCGTHGLRGRPAGAAWPCPAAHWLMARTHAYPMSPAQPASHRSGGMASQVGEQRQRLVEEMARIRRAMSLQVSGASTGSAP
jgi:hypothetical protein